MPGSDPVQPDFLIILQEHVGIIREGRIRGAPDLIVEVLSPGSVAYDEGVKPKLTRAGVPEYGVIDPATRRLRLYALQQRSARSTARILRRRDGRLRLPAVNQFSSRAVRTRPIRPCDA
ncbi:MAG: Uma2 family endonuclease [Anaerolineae bacterium]